MTGIKAHTIRIWEQRYNILSPNRTDTNIRFYTEEDMKRLLNIALLNRNGFKISQIASMNSNQLHERVLKLNENNFEQNNIISALVMAMITFDENSFEKIISSIIQRNGFEKTFIEIIFPFLNRIGILWQTGIIRPVHEHFITHLVRQKIMAATQRYSGEPHERSAKYMLFLPERELHELPLLFINFSLRSLHQQTLYLGAAVPNDDIFACYNDFKPEFIFTSCISHPNNGNVQSFINELAEQCSDSIIYISGIQVIDNAVECPRNVHLLFNVEECIRAIQKHKNLELAGK
jgi:DNA-binding transcriptional MerR regulator